MADINEQYETLRADILLVGLAPDHSTANYDNGENRLPFHGPTRRLGHIRAVVPEDWQPETFLKAALEEATTRGWVLLHSEAECLAFLKRTYCAPGKSSWYGVYGVLWCTTPTKES